MTNVWLPLPGSRRRSSAGGEILRWGSLLYSGYFFSYPFFRHDARVWLGFSVFYAIFLYLYFMIPAATGRTQKIALALFFMLGFVYYPFNRDAGGVFVFAFAMLAFWVTSLGRLVLVLAAQMSIVALETWLFGLPVRSLQSIVFFCVVIGVNNFAYAQQRRANELLERANEEIEQLTQEAERERIARDLHDLLGHTLTVITVKLDLARRLLPSEPDRARGEIVEAEQTARKALAEVREAVVGYRSQGLSSEIAHARRTLLSAEVQLTTSIAPVELSPAQVDVLCLALREAVTNIVRHAHASTARVELSSVNSHVCFSIADNGIGGIFREGNGLQGMRERIQALAGSITLSPTLPAPEATGTRLVIDLPPPPVQPPLAQPLARPLPASAWKTDPA